MGKNCVLNNEERLLKQEGSFRGGKTTCKVNTGIN